MSGGLWVGDPRVSVVIPASHGTSDVLRRLPLTSSRIHEVITVTQDGSALEVPSSEALVPRIHTIALADASRDRAIEIAIAATTGDLVIVLDSEATAPDTDRRDFENNGFVTNGSSQHTLNTSPVIQHQTISMWWQRARQSSLTWIANALFRINLTPTPRGDFALKWSDGDTAIRQAVEVTDDILRELRCALLDRAPANEATAALALGAELPASHSSMSPSTVTGTGQDIAGHDHIDSHRVIDMHRETGDSDAASN
jgi:hypothetical protein